MMKRLTALLLLLSLLQMTAASAELVPVVPEEVPTELEETELLEDEPGEAPAAETLPQTPAVEATVETLDNGAIRVTTEDGSWPQLNAQGFLDEGEFVYENTTDGIWRYCSATLKVEILRKTTDTPRLERWYEAEVWSISEVWDTAENIKGKHFSSTAYPKDVCTKRGCVLAVNGDYAATRWPWTKKSSKRNMVGILIRDGKIYNTYTKNADYKGFPNLDTLALFPDGDMQVFDSNEKTAQEYIDMGATDVFAFGPYLIRDGEINETAVNYFETRNAPRTVIGMIEKGHYMAIVMEGRVKTSNGASLKEMAQLLKDRGCTVGFNFDGGHTSCMMFMGKQINSVKDFVRKGAEFVAIGTSALVEGYDPDAE